MPSNPNRKIKLTAQTQSLYDANLTQSYKLIVDASEGSLMPNEVFLFFKIDPIPSYPDGSNVFKGICNPAQLVELPVNTPVDNSDNNYYRSSHIELTFTTESQATEAWTDIVAAISKLKNALDFGDGLATTTYWVQ